MRIAYEVHASVQRTRWHKFPVDTFGNRQTGTKQDSERHRKKTSQVDESVCKTIRIVARAVRSSAKLAKPTVETELNLTALMLSKTREVFEADSKARR